MRIKFVNDGAWRDRNGTHRRYEIKRGKQVLGMLEGESDALWQWVICDEHQKELSKHDTFAEAKAAARARWDGVDGSITPIMDRDRNNPPLAAIARRRSQDQS